MVVVHSTSLSCMTRHLKYFTTPFLSKNKWDKVQKWGDFKMEGPISWVKFEVSKL